MKHPEWLGAKEVIEKLLKKAGLYYVENAGAKKRAMKCIIVSKYIEYMTVQEILAKLAFECGYDISLRTYYDWQNEAIKELEKCT